MNLQDAIAYMVAGNKVKLPEWEGYWFIPQDQLWKEGTTHSDMVRVFTKAGDVLDTPWFAKYRERDDFEVTDGALDFGFAIRALKSDKRVRRKGWNGKGMYLIMFPGNETAKAFGYGFGEAMGEFTFSSVIGIKSAQNEMVLGWHPSTPDMLSTDWEIITE